MSGDSLLRHIIKLDTSINIPILRQLREYSVRLSGVSTSDSHQKTLFFREHRLNFVIS